MVEDAEREDDLLPAQALMLDRPNTQESILTESGDLTSPTHDFQAAGSDADGFVRELLAVLEADGEKLAVSYFARILQLEVFENFDFRDEFEASLMWALGDYSKRLKILLPKVAAMFSWDEDNQYWPRRNPYAFGRIMRLLAVERQWLALKKMALEGCEAGQGENCEAARALLSPFDLWKCRIYAFSKPVLMATTKLLDEFDNNYPELLSELDSRTVEWWRNAARAPRLYTSDFVRALPITFVFLWIFSSNGWLAADHGESSIILSQFFMGYLAATAVVLLDVFLGWRLRKITHEKWVVLLPHLNKTIFGRYVRDVMICRTDWKGGVLSAFIGFIVLLMVPNFVGEGAFFFWVPYLFCWAGVWLLMVTFKVLAYRRANVR